MICRDRRPRRSDDNGGSKPPPYIMHYVHRRVVYNSHVKNSTHKRERCDFRMWSEEIIIYLLELWCVPLGLSHNVWKCLKRWKSLLVTSNIICFAQDILYCLISFRGKFVAKKLFSQYTERQLIRLQISVFIIAYFS